MESPPNGDDGIHYTWGYRPSKWDGLVSTGRSIFRQKDTLSIVSTCNKHGGILHHGEIPKLETHYNNEAGGGVTHVISAEQEDVWALFIVSISIEAIVNGFTLMINLNL